MENIRVKINTLQTIDDAGNEDEIELITEATLDKSDGCFIISYDESELAETEGCRTRIKIFKDKMLMTKIGPFSSKMEFEKGISSGNIYSTPYGSFDIDYSTVVYENTLDENGRGKVYVEYYMVFGNSEQNYNKLKIEVL